MLEHPQLSNQEEFFATLAISVREVGQGVRDALLVRVVTEDDAPIPTIIWDFLLDIKELHGVSYKSQAYPSQGHIISIIKDELLESP